MNANTIIREIKIRAREHRDNPEYQEAVKYLIKKIKKYGRLTTYDSEFKGLVLNYLKDEYKCWNVHHRTRPEWDVLRKKRAEAVVDLIDFIVKEWRD